MKRAYAFNVQTEEPFNKYISKVFGVPRCETIFLLHFIPWGRGLFQRNVSHTMVAAGPCRT